MKRLLLPLLAALTLPTAVRADNAFGYGMQMCQMMSSGRDPFEAQKIISDFVKAWTKVMNLDRFDLR